MKRLLTLLLLALMVIPALAEDKEGGIIIIKKEGILTTRPTEENQFLGSNGPNPEWETLSGGSGNCVFTRTSAGNYELDCPLYAANAVTVISPTPPTKPQVGQLWFDPTTLQTYIFYNDGTSSQWVPIVNLTNGVPPPGSTLTNPIFLGTVTFPDGSTWTNSNITIAGNTTLTGPDGGKWTSTGITLPATSEFTGGSFDLTSGGSWSSTGLTVNNITITGSLPSTFNNITVTGNTTLNTITVNGSSTFNGTITGPDGGTWTTTGITLPSGSELTGGSFDLTSGGTWNSSGLTTNNLTVSGNTTLNSLTATGIINLAGFGTGGWGWVPEEHGHVYLGPIMFQWGDCHTPDDLLYNVGEVVRCSFDVPFGNLPVSIAISMNEIGSTQAASAGLRDLSLNYADFWVFNPSTNTTGPGSIEWIAIGPK